MKNNSIFLLGILLGIVGGFIVGVKLSTTPKIYLNQEQEKCEKAGGEFDFSHWDGRSEIIDYHCYSISKEIKLN